MLLENINSPLDLKRLSLDQLPQLASEVRGRMVEVVSKTGGHLASSLGAVELIIALHYCLDTPRDKLVFDVGHQAYAHKMLTGRNKAFDKLRQCGGLSGFPCREESEYDIFTTGHSSNAISIALGLVCGRDCNSSGGKSKVVAVVGDGSLSGGLSFEGLNNAGHLKKDILVILNTNELSIAPNVGALSTYLNKLISLPIYNRFREQLESFVKTRIPTQSRILRLANKFEEELKGLFLPGIFFEELGFRYFGPYDGHNLPKLIPALRNILNIKGPRILHVVTKKGKGYFPAENNPVRFHGTGPFDLKTGFASVSKERKSYTDVFSEKLVSLARVDKKILAITAAMPEGTGLDKFAALFPDRFFDVGIAEGHAVSFAGGLARAGFKPVVALYSTFLQRAYDQIIEDVALQRAPVVFAVDRAGIVGEDGMTHQGIFDISFLRNIPNLVFMAPKDDEELESMLEFALGLNKPVAIRYPRGVCPVLSQPVVRVELAKAQLLKEGKDFIVIALGSMVGPAEEALDLLKKEGVSGTLINARFVKPLDIQLLKNLCLDKEYIFTVEEGVLDGGFGSAVSEAINKPVTRIGLPCEFIPQGRRSAILEKYGLTAQGIAKRIKSVYGKDQD
ncbi:MAG: 1-deoxy-D-xylulose-5-phosphate synthase [Candidatus Omnitrophica bacterium]|nr:1-deoxy-D-xylulose-5-phosphate synthase [Candidatus Omnitrophota bacterium]MBU1870353.1 1-deoxy-D-xylulose-5-phosphate synthase [Candidatus Omnitrophota bacterium]